MKEHLQKYKLLYRSTPHVIIYSDNLEHQSALQVRLSR
jgi:hypothetical protein